MSTMTDNLTGQEWLDRYGVAFDWRADGFHRDDHSGWEHQLFTLTLDTGGAADGDPVEIQWRQGLGVETDPTPDDTLWAIAGDVRYGQMGWPEFADEFGYDELDAPLSQYRTWEACREMATKLSDYLPGPAFAGLLTVEEVDADTDE